MTLIGGGCSLQVSQYILRLVNKPMVTKCEKKLFELVKCWMT